MEDNKSVVAENTRREAVENDNENKENIYNNMERSSVAIDCGGEKIADSTATTAESSSQKKKIKKNKNKENNRIQVSKNKKPFIFYLNLAKRFVKQYTEVELSALGMAIPTVVTIAEILKRDGSANYKEITVSALDFEDGSGHIHHKPKILIVMAKTERLNMAIDAAPDTTPKKTAAITTPGKANASTTPKKPLACITPAEALASTTVKRAIAV